MIKNFFAGLMILFISYWCLFKNNWFILGLILTIMGILFIFEAYLYEKEIFKRIKKLEKLHKEKE